MKFGLEKLGLDRFSLDHLNLKSLVSPGNGAAAGVGVVVAPYLEFLYGSGRNDVLMAFYGVIMMDWIAGIAAAHKDKIYSSEYGISGIFRTLFILLFPAISNFLDKAMGTPGFLFFAVTFGLIYHYWQSMTANAYRAWGKKFIPQFVVDFVGSEIKAKSERAMQKFANLEQSKKEEK